MLLCALLLVLGAVARSEVGGDFVGVDDEQVVAVHDDFDRRAVVDLLASSE